MKIVLITSTGLRHRYIAAQLAKQCELALIVSELKSEKIENTTSLSVEDVALIDQHFKRRQESELQFFGSYMKFLPEVPVLDQPHGEINSEEFANRVDELKPDQIILFGSSILKGSLLKKYHRRVINLHLGLSPYYVGSGTNLFPYYYGEPEGVGATIHLATAKVDEGDILQQLRPEIEPEDDLHSIGNKVILLAGKELPGVLKDFQGGKITPQPQLPPRRICRIKDFTPDVLREILHKIDNGLLKEYLLHKESRNAAMPIVP